MSKKETEKKIYFRIKNWDKYQHRDHKKYMPWIKFYVSQLDDEITSNLSLEDFGFWSRLLLHCSKISNRLSIDYRLLSKNLGIYHVKSVKKKMDLLESLGLVERYLHNTERGATAPTPRLDIDREKKESSRRAAPLCVDTPLGAPTTPLKSNKILKTTPQFGDKKGVRKRAKKDTEIELKKSPNLVPIYVDYFRLKYGCDPVITGKTAGMLKNMLKSMSFEKASELIRAYFLTNDQFFIKKRHPVELLITNLNQIQVTMKTGVMVTSKTAKQVEEVDASLRAAERFLNGD